MPTNYLLFIHGVSTRREGNILPSYADPLITLIKSKRCFEKLVVYWGDVNNEQEAKLLEAYEDSSQWKSLWFKSLRSNHLLTFTGDLALYLSRAIGAAVAHKVAQECKKIISTSSEDRLHLVTHSLGTVILFDLLFSTRWDDCSIPGHDDVMDIRDIIYGVQGREHTLHQGINLGSITTMGSPIGIFSLMSAQHIRKQPTKYAGKPTAPVSSHDITPRLRQLLEQRAERSPHTRLPWMNFLHPGDPIGSTLEHLIPQLVDPHHAYIDIRDCIVPETFAMLVHENFFSCLLDILAWCVQATPLAALALANTSNAHGSYWHSPTVADQIIAMI